MTQVIINTMFLVTLLFLGNCKSHKNKYECPPCDMPCDQLTFNHDGICPHCNMNLIMKVEKSSVNDIALSEGSGNFLIKGGFGKERKIIKVFYHKPTNYNSDSRIVIVLPGAGRNGDEYRDSWVEASEKKTVLVLVPSYLENDYDFGAYHMCGIIHDINLEDNIISNENSNHHFLNEKNLKFEINSNKEGWIFNDFDRLFDVVVQELGSSQIMYDLFGHSAGGQISHRLAIFYPQSKVNRIISSNSGTYTIPSFSENLPFGIGNSSLTRQDIEESFKLNLTLLIGAKDNENETRGLLLRSSSADKQGMHRLARGKYFFMFSKSKAGDMNIEFNWNIQIVPEVGHDYREMSKAAAVLLYGD